MESVLYNGSMLGVTLDFSSTEQYVVGTTQTRPAPIFVGSQTYTRGGSTTDTAVTFALTGGVSTTPQAGDFVVLSIAIGQTGSTSAPQGITGYTTLGQVVGADTYDAGLYVGTKVMGSTPDTTFPVRSSYSIENAQAAVVFVWRNVEALDVTSTTASGANSRAANPPAITPVTENSIIMAVGAAAHVGGAVNYTNTELQGFRSAAGSDTYDVSLGAGYVNWTSGAFDPAAFTISGSTTSDSWAALTLALKPVLIETPVYGNYKNSGIWNLQSAFQALYESMSPSAPSLVGVSSVAAGSTNSLVLTVPTHLPGDLLLAFMVGSFSGTSDWTQASWIQLYDRNGNGGPAIFYKIAGSSEPSTYTFSQANNNSYSGAMAVFRNAQVDVVGTAALDTDPLVAPSISVSENNSILIGFYGANSASRTPSTPTGMSNIIMDNNASSPSFAVFTQTVNLGSSGTRSSTIGNNNATTGILLSLKSSG